MTQMCECGCGSEAQVKHTDLYEEKIVYFLCRNCEISFVCCNLTPSQFKELMEKGHTDEEFMLHGDFYDEEGVALQPTEVRRRFK